MTGSILNFRIRQWVNKYGSAVIGAHKNSRLGPLSLRSIPHEIDQPYLPTFLRSRRLNAPQRAVFIHQITKVKTVYIVTRWRSQYACRPGCSSQAPFRDISEQEAKASNTGISSSSERGKCNFDFTADIRTFDTGR